MGESVAKLTWDTAKVVGAILLVVIPWVWAAAVFWSKLNAHMDAFEKAQRRNDQAHYWLLQRELMGDNVGPIPPDLLIGLTREDSP
jgi:hypothetical protein